VRLVSPIGSATSGSGNLSITLKIKLIFKNKIGHFLKKNCYVSYQLLSERDEKSGGCHLKKLVMTSLRQNQ
jgi:hypothetical protein